MRNLLIFLVLLTTLGCVEPPATRAEECDQLARLYCHDEYPVGILLSPEYVHCKRKIAAECAASILEDK